MHPTTRTPEFEPSASTPPPRRWPILIPPALALALAGMAFGSRAHADARLFWSLTGAAVVLGVWSALLAALPAARRRGFSVQPTAIASHYVQALVQATIYVYWGWHWPDVRAQVPLILAQIVYLYAFDALLSWSRGRTWRLGFGPLPVMLSTNLLLWFRDDWFFLQFAMVTAGALGKEFVRWNRDGRSTHVFNPSVFGQSLAALVLIALGATRICTRGEEIAASFEQLPHILVLLFGLGLVVQYLFSVTLMTLSATAVLCIINVGYTAITGTYFFTALNIGATIFLGLHLLVTDPSTSPRTNTGRVLFGALYAIGYTALFRLFGDLGVPLFWDKLLPVPVLNLLVPAIDRLARSGILGRLDRRWEAALAPRALNLVHMGCWAALFLTLLSTGFVEGRHEGRTIAFWKKAYDEGRYQAGEKLLELAEYRASRDSGEACNMLGLLYLEGKLVEKDDVAAAHYFARACELGYAVGCENVAGQFLFEQRARSPEDVARALDRLEQDCASYPDGIRCFLAGLAYDLGRGRPAAKARAIALYEEGCRKGNADSCAGLARIAGEIARGPDEMKAGILARRSLARLQEEGKLPGAPAR